MIGQLRMWFRGLALLRHPELVRDLGERRFEIQRISRLRKRYPGAKIDARIYIANEAVERIILSDQCTISYGTILSGGGSDDEGTIQIGARTWVGQYNNLRAGSGSIDVGEDCLISQFCTLVACNHGINRSQNIQSQTLDQSRCGVTLGCDVWLGAGVTVLPGVTIGQGAVIGANAVVAKDVPEYEIHAGVPAKRIGCRE